MDINIEQVEGGCHLIQCKGELRATDGAAMYEQLHPLITEPESRMMVDLSGVTWMDSGGLSHLISLVTHSRLSKSRVILVGASPFVAGVLEVTGLNDWFESAEDVAAAQKLLVGGT